MHLQSKTIIVTGAGSGIGAALALKLGQSGANVVLAGRRPEPLKLVAEQVKEAGGDALVVPGDLRKRKNADKLAAETEKSFGQIDVLVNNAGLIQLANFFQMTEEDWDTTFDTNLKSVFLLCKAVVPRMVAQREGRIINVSSVAGVNGISRSPAYAASKAGLIGFSRHLAMNLKQHGIAVSCINPGLVYTPFHAGGEMPDRDRCMEPEDIADTIIHLLKLPERAVLKEILIMPRDDI
jgi:NAD(P)-dependent dehydrogenase (short-subunit alcohol dehydrogenase family)